MEQNKTASIPLRCRAAVARKAGEPLSIEEVIVAPPKSGEVRVQIICSSLCHTDVSFWKLKDPPAYFPTILGHECFGVVESVGENVDELTRGDSVIPVFLPDCRECRDCISSKSNLCSNFHVQCVPWLHRDQQIRFTDINGVALHHFFYISSFSEYTVVDIVHITKVDANIPPNRACLLSCGVSTGVAAFKTANVEAGSTVAIFGLGAIKLAMIIAMTDGGADYCFECVGMASLVREAFACCRKQCIIQDVFKPGAELTLSSIEVLRSGKTLTGCLFGGLKPKSDVPMLVKQYLDNELEQDKFVTHEVNFEDINKAFDLLTEGKSLRCIIWMNQNK